MDFLLTLGFIVLAAGASVSLTALWLRRSEGQAETTLATTEARLQAALRDRDSAIEARVAAERGAAGARAEVTAMEERIADFERVRREMLDAAKAAVTDTAAQVSSKLLDDHKRETTEAKQHAEERVKQVSDHLKEGQSVRVKVLEADEKGRLRLSMKAVGADAAQH